MHPVIGIIIIRMKKSKADYREITLFPIYSNTPTPHSPRDPTARTAVWHSAWWRTARSRGQCRCRFAQCSGALYARERVSCWRGARVRVCMCACVEVFGERGRGEER